MFPRHYFAARYFAPRYFPQSQGQSSILFGEMYFDATQIAFGGAEILQSNFAGAEVVQPAFAGTEQVQF